MAGGILIVFLLGWLLHRHFKIALLLLIILIAAAGHH
jgi:hypothetical protein